MRRLEPAEPGDFGPGLLRQPPHNVEVERALLGAILVNNRTYEKVEAVLRPEHFTEQVNARIFEVIQQLIGKGQTVNAVTLKTFLEYDDLVKAAGGMKYLAALSSSMVTTINAGDYGKLIYDLHLRRELINLGEEMVNAAYDGQVDESASEQIDRAGGRLDELSTTTGHAKHLTTAEVVAATVAEWDAADKDPAGGLSTGIKALDEAAGRLVAGDLIFLAGNTSMGKTALATTIMDNAAGQGSKVAFFTLEMSGQQLTGRLITAATGIPGPRQRRWALDANQWGDVIGASQRISDLPMTLRHVPGLTLQGLRTMARQIKRKSGLDLLIVDYLQIMGGAFDRYENRNQQIGRLTMGLKTLAGELDVPIICLSQLSRENWRRENPRPILPDLRDSGSIEQDGDGVWFCYREEYFLERTRPERKDTETAERFMERLRDHETRLENCRGIGEVIIAKNRHGPPGTARLQFDAKRAWFQDLPTSGTQHGLGLD